MRPVAFALSDPGDRFERAADATADKVMSSSGGSSSSSSASSGTSVQLEEADDMELPVQREMAGEEDEMTDEG